MLQNKKLYCVIPIYNDWESFSILINKISILQSSKLSEYDITVIVVNDCSFDEAEYNVPNDITVKILNLKMNVGHQRAIAIGLQYIYNEAEDADYIVVMDGDGEDRPEDIPILLEKAGQVNKIVFAQRNKRNDSTLFNIGYFFYKRLFYFLTGQEINFGNFSVIPSKYIARVAHINNIWNHYSGAIIQSKTPYEKILLDRGTRYKGNSKMNFNSLILHGLSSIAVYFDYLSLKILRYSASGILLCFIAIAVILYQKMFTTNAIPGWASSLTLIITGIVLQLFTLTLIVLLLQLSSRKNITSPNHKIYKDFIN